MLLESAIETLFFNHLCFSAALAKNHENHSENLKSCVILLLSNAPLVEAGDNQA